MDLTADEVNVNPFTVPEDGWIVKVAFSDKTVRTFIKIDGFGEVGITPGQYYIGSFYKNYGSTESYPVGICNVNCPYPVKKGQVVSPPRINNMFLTGTVTITFAPNKSV